jgi:hypothetical protein
VRRSQLIQRAIHPATALVQDVGVDHRRFHTLVAEQFLNRADVGPVLDQVRRETVPQCVRVVGLAIPAVVTAARNAF